MRDIASDTPVVEADLTEAVHDFCVDNPDDEDCVVADLAVTAVTAVDPPPLVLVGTPAAMTVRTVMANNGPDSPVDSHVTRIASSTPGVTVTPASVEQDEDALAVDVPRTLDQGYTTTCDQPGAASVTFTSTIATTHPADVDPNPANDVGALSVPVDCAVPVTVNIKPGGDPNSVNIGPRGNDIPLAVLTTAAGEYGNPLAFDATTIDALSARFGTRATVLGGMGSAETHSTGTPRTPTNSMSEPVTATSTSSCTSSRPGPASS